MNNPEKLDVIFRRSRHKEPEGLAAYGVKE